jgi:hypothetical protein
MHDQSISEYKGTGTVQHHSSIPPAPCNFVVDQLKNGEIILSCEIDFKQGLPHFKLSPKVDLVLQGLTTDGEILAINGPALAGRTEFSFGATIEPTIVYYRVFGISTVQVGNCNWSDQSTIRFSITNFKFLGTEVEEVKPGKRALNALKITVGGHEIYIRKVKNYEEILGRLSELGGSDITCEASMQTSNSNDFASAKDTIDNLCHLLSIASGTLVSWIFCEVFDAAGGRIYVEHRPSITRNFVLQSLIDPRQTTEIKVFVEKTYDNYVQLLGVYRMIQVVHAFTEAHGNNFLDTRGLIISSLVEYLTGEKFTIKKGTFKARVEQFCVNHAVPVTALERNEFVKNRNFLVHDAAFSSPNEYGEFVKMMHFLDRIILRLLGYSGFYLNCTNWERETI